MSDKNQSSENPEQENLDTVNQDDIDSGAMDALNDAEQASAKEEALTLEQQQAAEIAELKDKLLRNMAEMENIRRRLKKTRKTPTITR